VQTLGLYLAYRGSYDAASKALSVHRSMLKYRLQRIRDISAQDLTAPSRSSICSSGRARQTRGSYENAGCPPCRARVNCLQR